MVSEICLSVLAIAVCVVAGLLVYAAIRSVRDSCGVNVRAAERERMELTRMVERAYEKNLARSKNIDAIHAQERDNASRDRARMELDGADAPVPPTPEIPQYAKEPWEAVV